MRRLLCRWLGHCWDHVEVWRARVDSVKRYHCARCGREVWVSRGGAALRPDPMGVALLLAGASLAVYTLIALWVAGLVP